MNKTREYVVVANYKVLELRTGRWRYSIGKATRLRIAHEHGVAIPDTDESVLATEVNDDGLHMPQLEQAYLALSQQDAR